MSRVARFGYCLAIVGLVGIVLLAWTAIPDCPDVSGMCSR
jgi:hypothetical protein